MGKALYRKYRSKSLAEIIGQEHITHTLGRALKSGNVSHAYLLTGPRGVGKTSIARILAYEVNGLPYDEDASHLDIIEIDAASNRRIDEIRELKERVNIAPSSAKYKVYIIDEVHMLTKEAFNALLKTLEEPPEHAIFILATTEAHKVPETIISRTQRFTFKPVTQDKVISHLKQIVKSEKIDISDEALALISAHGEGSFRDSISLLDQMRHVSDKIELSDVQQAIGQAPNEILEELLSAVNDRNVANIAKYLSELKVHGVQAPQVAIQISDILRNNFIISNSILSPKQTLQLLSALLQVPSSSDPSLSLELALYDCALESNETAVKNHEKVPEPTKAISPKANISPAKPTVAENINPQTPNTKPKPDKTTKPISQDLSEESLWQEILNAVKGNHNTLYGIARMAIPVVDGNNITLKFAFPFHMNRLNDNKNKQLLMDIASRVAGKDISIECITDSKAKPAPAPTKPKTPNAKNINIETISNIFGGAEIVE